MAGLDGCGRLVDPHLGGQGLRLRAAAAAVLTALNTAVKDLGRSVAAHLGEHPDGPSFTSLPRSGQIKAAQMPAEWGDCRQAYDGR
jgi:transposase